MKETQTSKKLTLKKETLKTLSEKELAQVAGGMMNPTRQTCSDICTATGATCECAGW